MLENGSLNKSGCTKVVLIRGKMAKLNFGCWSCGEVYENFIYVKSLLRTLDVLALSEHWLYEDELTFLDSLDINFDVFSCSSSVNNTLERLRRGHGGVALYFKKLFKSKRNTNFL